jgi:hypothetical protein
MPTLFIVTCSLDEVSGEVRHAQFSVQQERQDFCSMALFARRSFENTFWELIIRPSSVQNARYKTCWNMPIADRGF